MISVEVFLSNLSTIRAWNRVNEHLLGNLGAGLLACLGDFMDCLYCSLR